jgi:hypothetical protein
MTKRCDFKFVFDDVEKHIDSFWCWKTPILMLKRTDSPNWGRTFDCTTHNMSVFMSCSLTQLYGLCAQLWIVNVLACWPVV